MNNVAKSFHGIEKHLYARSIIFFFKFSCSTEATLGIHETFIWNFSHYEAIRNNFEYFITNFFASFHRAIRPDDCNKKFL